MARGQYSELSSLLPAAKPPWRAFGTSVTLQVALVAVLVLVPLLAPQELEVFQAYKVTPLVAAPKPYVPPEPAVKPKPAQQPRTQPVETPAVAEAPAKRPVFPTQFAAAPRPNPARVRAEAADAPSFQAAVQPAKLPFGSSALPTLKRPREEVQTGGFGDPHGVPASGKGDRAANIAQLGSYDLPPGPGYGNGTGGASGARGTVASTGFGNGVAVPVSGGSGRRGGVATGGFGQQPVAAPPARERRAAPPQGPLDPVEILFKPKPAYTDAARELRIEGQVLLEAQFTASGEVRVLRVVRGLGHGLDESAAAAAKQIRFRPARRGGQPVDTVGTVHILFQLAN